MSDATTISLAAWDAPVPVVAGEMFAIKVGAKAADGRALAGCRIEVSDASGAVVATGALGDSPWPGAEALYWCALDVPAPAAPQVTPYQVLLADAPGGTDVAATVFTIVAAGRPEHTLAVNVTEQDSRKPLANVEVRLGPFHARTDATGHAELRVCKGAYEVRLWRAAHVAAPTTLTVAGDSALALTMRHVPEEHPDARWVR